MIERLIDAVLVIIFATALFRYAAASTSGTAKPGQPGDLHPSDGRPPGPRKFVIGPLELAELEEDEMEQARRLR